MQLLEYYVPRTKWTVIKEATSDGRTITKVKGRCGLMEELNKNKRKYPKPTMEAAVKAIQEKISNRELTGALDHPTNTNILLSQSSHLITKLWTENNEVLWEAEVLPTPSGRILQDLIDAKVTVGISSRGEGSLIPNEDGTSMVGEDFRLVTYDIVADPSTFGAYASLSESVENKKKIDEIFASAKKDANVGVFLNILKNKITERIDANKAKKNELAKKIGSGSYPSGDKNNLRVGRSKMKNPPASNLSKAGEDRKFSNTVPANHKEKYKKNAKVFLAKSKSDKKPKLPESKEEVLNLIIDSLETRGRKGINPIGIAKLARKAHGKKVGKKVAKDVAKHGKGDINAKIVAHNESKVPTPAEKAQSEKDFHRKTYSKKPKDWYTKYFSHLDKLDKEEASQPKVKKTNEEVVNYIVEGLTKRLNKAKKNAYMLDRGEKAVKMHGEELASKFGKKRKDNIKGIGRSFNLADNDPDEVYHKTKNFKKANESFDILIEGIVKKLNKAKKKEFMISQGGKHGKDSTKLKTARMNTKVGSYKAADFAADSRRSAQKTKNPKLKGELKDRARQYLKVAKKEEKPKLPEQTNESLEGSAKKLRKLHTDLKSIIVDICKDLTVDNIQDLMYTVRDLHDKMNDMTYKAENLEYASKNKKLSPTSVQTK